MDVASRVTPRVPASPTTNAGLGVNPTWRFKGTVPINEL